MSAFSRARELLRALVFRRSEEKDLDDELRFHLEMETAANERRGMTPQEARRRAFASFGGVERHKEEVRDARGSQHLERLALDMRYAVRWLRRSPAFTITAATALALGIGANTAVSSVVNGVVLRPLPFPHPEHVVFLGWEYGNGGGIPALTSLEFEFWRERSTVFEGVATSRTFTAELNGDAAEPLVHGIRVSGDFFDVVGTSPVIGRSFVREENEPGGPHAAILSHRFWLGRFGGDSSVLGRPLRLGKEVHTIVGIMPASFRLVGNGASSDDVIVPLQLRVDPQDKGNNYEVLARVLPDRSEQEVTADLARVAAEFHAAHPELSDHGKGSVYLASYGDVYTGDLATTLWILLGATIFVLFIACADVASLLLARASGRQREIATRIALGAGRPRVIRQLLTESMALGLLGGGAGLLVGVGSVRALLGLMPGSLPRADEIGLDMRVLSFTLFISIATSAVFGLVSALAATRTEPGTALKEGGRAGESVGRRRTHHLFVAVQTCVSLVLLVGAGLLIASFVRLSRLDPGFDARNVTVATFDRTPDGYDSTAAIWRFEREVLERLRSTPGVEAAAATSVTPLACQWNLPVTVEGRPDATEGAVQWRAVSPGFFQTMRIPLLRGRPFTDVDGTGAPDVAIITESMARRYWPDGNPIGQRIMLGVFEGKKMSADQQVRPREIVGIVGDTRDISLDRTPRRTVYIPQAQVPDDWGLSLPTFLVRGRSDSRTSRASLAGIMRAVDPRVRPPTLESLSALMAASIEGRRFTMLLMTLFAGIALVLTATGIYGVIAYTVGRRQREIGVRLALGARGSDVLLLVISQAMGAVALGLGAGVAVALLATRVLAGMVYGVSVRDPLILTLVLCLLTSVALVAAYLPGRRAVRIDPSMSLRAE